MEGGPNSTTVQRDCADAVFSRVDFSQDIMPARLPCSLTGMLTASNDFLGR